MKIIGFFDFLSLIFQNTIINNKTFELLNEQKITFTDSTTKIAFFDKIFQEYASKRRLQRLVSS